MRELKDIRADINRTIREIDAVDVMSPDFDLLIEKRNRLMIELEQHACPVYKQEGEIKYKTIPKPTINRFRN